jgi:TetR/AcrR family transcriptional regulator
MSRNKASDAPPDQRAAILANSAALFASRGYPSTTMNDVADASSLSKATLYHYFSEKGELLQTIADSHVSRLVTIVQDIEEERHPPEDWLRLLIAGFMREYESAHHAHRVLTEDVRFLNPEARDAILTKERVVVSAFARALVAIRPELRAAKLEKPLTMLLFGMMNWMFTWLQPAGRLSYEEMATVVTDLFFGGFPNVRIKGD